MKSSGIRLREAKPSDFAKVAEMHYEVWRRSWNGMLADFLLGIIGSPRHWATTSYPQTLSQRGWSMWIAESGGEILGMTVFGPDAANPDDLQIEALYTAEGSQRRGIGGRLLNRAMRSNSSGDVILWCAEGNAQARRFYENNDFEVDGRSYLWQPLPGVSVPHVGYRLRRQ